MLTEDKGSSTNGRLAKLVAQFFGSDLTDDIAAVIVGHAAEEHCVRVLQRDAHRVVV
ncbi:hypothetical protein D3C76_1493850 [compost metagenome]